MICMSVPSHLLRARKLRTSANRLFPDESWASRFPILEWDRAHMINGIQLRQLCRSCNLTFASFSSLSRLKTLDHTSDKKSSMPTSSKGCGGKNEVVPQPVRAWKGGKAVDCLDIKILSLFRGS